MILFISDIFHGLLNWYSNIIFNIFKNEINLIIFCIISSAILALVIIKLKKSIPKKVAIFFFWILILVLLIILPFNRGRNTEKLLSLGYRITELVENHKKIYGEYPNSIEEIKFQDIEKEDSILILNNFDYRLKYLERDSTYNYVLHIKPDYLNNEYYFYHEPSKSFILTD